MSFVFPQFASTTPKCRLFQKGGVSCDACNSAAVVICDSSRELYCAKHAPSTISSTATICNKKQKNAEHKKKVREYRERVHPASVKVATALRVELGLYGSVTSSPLCSSGVPMRVEGSVTLLLKAPRGNQTGGRGLLRMPELHSARLGPVLLSDGVSVWSLWLSNAMASLQWFNTQTMSESDAMGALIRESGTVYGQKFNYPGFKKTTTDLELRCLRIPPLLDASKNNDNNTVGYENMPVCIQELMLSGATLTPIEVPNHDARALFCGLYAHLAEPWVEKKLRPLLRSGVSIHVADGLSMNSDVDAQFHEIFGRQFQEEACITCMLRGGVMPWDDYLRGRMSAAKVGLDTHLVFCSVISLFFGTKYCS